MHLRQNQANNPTKEQGMTFTLKRSVLATAVASLVAAPAYATNGMNMEAYGAKAGGMGGASFAYDSGNSAMMNNPATLGLQKEKNSFGIGLTWLRPNVDTFMGVGTSGMNASSGGDSYLMPTLSFMRKTGKFTYGVGVLAQGGMGTEYDTHTFLSMGTGLPVRSEVGFGRLMFPLAYNVNDALTIAGQVDFVWAGMDLQMVTMDPNAGPVYIDFSNDSDFTGEATGTGWAFKLGAHYKINKAWSLGATYHSKTDIDDLEGYGSFTILSSQSRYAAKYKVIDFQWPETYGIGVAWNATDKLMLAADIKHIGWSDSMKDFRLAVDIGMGWNESVMPQNWRDQTIYMMGGQYMITPSVALRAGYSYADNPVPDSTLNPLFPATIKSHYTLGVGWNIGKGHTLAASLAYAPQVEQTNPNMFGPNAAGTVTHSQTTWRVNYNYNF
ncbi:MAG: outer membrane protein transport protein [Halothiobacillaceae bacterium]